MLNWLRLILRLLSQVLMRGPILDEHEDVLHCSYLSDERMPPAACRPREHETNRPAIFSTMARVALRGDDICAKAAI